MHPGRQTSRLGPNPLGRPILVKGSRVLSQQPTYQIGDPAPSLPKNFPLTYPSQRPQDAKDQIPQAVGCRPQQRLVSIQPLSFPEQIQGGEYRAYNNHSVPTDGPSSQSRRRITFGASQISRPATGDFWDQIVPRRPQVFPEIRAQRALAATRQRIEDLEGLHQRQNSNTHSLIDPRLQGNTSTGPIITESAGRPGNPSNGHIPVFLSRNYDGREENTVVDIHEQDRAQCNKKPTQKRKVRDTMQSPERPTKNQRVTTTSNAMISEDNFIDEMSSLLDDTKYYKTSASKNGTIFPTLWEKHSASQVTSQANRSSQATAALSNKLGPRMTDRLHLPQLDEPVQQAHNDCNLLAIEALLVKSFGERIKDDKEVWDLINLYVGEC